MTIFDLEYINSKDSDDDSSDTSNRDISNKDEKVLVLMEIAMTVSMEKITKMRKLTITVIMYQVMFLMLLSHPLSQTSKSKSSQESNLNTPKR